jgi:hypothetical protein
MEVPLVSQSNEREAHQIKTCWKNWVASTIPVFNVRYAACLAIRLPVLVQVTNCCLTSRPWKSAASLRKAYRSLSWQCDISAGYGGIYHRKIQVISCCILILSPEYENGTKKLLLLTCRHLLTTSVYRCIIFIIGYFYTNFSNKLHTKLIDLIALNFSSCYIDSSMLLFFSQVLSFNWLSLLVNETSIFRTDWDEDWRGFHFFYLS